MGTMNGNPSSSNGSSMKTDGNMSTQGKSMNSSSQKGKTTKMNSTTSK
jgi:hypothetical protein